MSCSYIVPCRFSVSRQAGSHQSGVGVTGVGGKLDRHKRDASAAARTADCGGAMLPPGPDACPQDGALSAVLRARAAPPRPRWLLLLALLARCAISAPAPRTKHSDDEAQSRRRSHHLLESIAALSAASSTPDLTVGESQASMIALPD